MSVEFKMNSKIFARYVIRETMGVVIMGVALFWSAGRLDWWAGWACLSVIVAWTIATAVVILRTNPDLLAERLGPRKGAKSWDTAILSLLGISQLVRYVVAGLDQRYGWTGDLSFWAQFSAWVICILGYAMVTWATAANAFFSQVVRIQTERLQTVVSSGPYRVIRHPAYLGAIIFELAVPVLLASWWALLPSLLNALLLLLRTALEDKALQAELDGYPEYAHRVPHRLLPGIW